MFWLEKTFYLKNRAAVLTRKRKWRKQDFFAAFFYEKWHLQTSCSPILKFVFKFFVSVHSFHILKSLVLLLPSSVLLSNCLIFLFDSRCTVGDFSSPSHSIGTRWWKRISSFSKIICARNEWYALSAGATENMRQSTLLTEMEPLITDCQAHHRVLSAFAKWLKTKPNQLKQCVFCQQPLKSTPL